MIKRIQKFDWELASTILRLFLYTGGVVGLAILLTNGIETKSNQFEDSYQRLIKMEKELIFIRAKLEEKK